MSRFSSRKAKKNSTSPSSLKGYIDLDRLRKIAEITKPARNGNTWKKSAWRRKYEKCRIKALKEYVQFLKDLVAKYVPYFDEEKHAINVMSIYVSKEADEIIQQILFGADYLAYGLAYNEALGLKKNECIILLDTVLFVKNPFEDAGGAGNDRQGKRNNGASKTS